METGNNDPKNYDAKAKAKAIDFLALAGIEKEYGKGAIMRLKDGALAPEVQTVPTGSISLDGGLGIGGIPGSHH